MKIFTALLFTLAFCGSAFAQPFAVPAGKPLSYPDWWFTRGVLARTNPSATSANWPLDYVQADDYAVANVGQLKWVASKAADELTSLLPVVGAGDEINQMVRAWRAVTPPPGVVRDDYAAVSAGQLKNVAAKFYDFFKRLNLVLPPAKAAGGGFLGGEYPWAGSTQADDYAVVNLGQLKYLFSFNTQLLSEVSWTANTDGDSLPDAWEKFYFGNTGATDAGDGEVALGLTSDGLSNALEYVLGTNPTTTALTDPASTTVLSFVVFEAY